MVAAANSVPRIASPRSLEDLTAQANRAIDELVKQVLQLQAVLTKHGLS